MAFLEVASHYGVLGYKLPLLCSGIACQYGVLGDRQPLWCSEITGHYSVFGEASHYSVLGDGRLLCSVLK